MQASTTPETTAPKLDRQSRPTAPRFLPRMSNAHLILSRAHGVLGSEQVFAFCDLGDLIWRAEALTELATSDHTRPHGTSRHVMSEFRNADFLFRPPIGHEETKSAGSG